MNFNFSVFFTPLHRWRLASFKCPLHFFCPALALIKFVGLWFLLPFFQFMPLLSFSPSYPGLLRYFFGYKPFYFLSRWLSQDMSKVTRPSFLYFGSKYHVLHIHFPSYLFICNPFSPANFKNSSENPVLESIDHFPDLYCFWPKFRSMANYGKYNFNLRLRI